MTVTFSFMLDIEYERECSCPFSVLTYSFTNAYLKCQPWSSDRRDVRHWQRASYPSPLKASISPGGTPGSLILGKHNARAASSPSSSAGVSVTSIHAQGFSNEGNRNYGVVSGVLRIIEWWPPVQLLTNAIQSWKYISHNVETPCFWFNGRYHSMALRTVKYFV